MHLLINSNGKPCHYNWIFTQYADRVKHFRYVQLYYYTLAQLRHDPKDFCGVIVVATCGGSSILETATPLICPPTKAFPQNCPQKVKTAKITTHYSSSVQKGISKCKAWFWRQSGPTLGYLMRWSLSVCDISWIKMCFLSKQLLSFTHGRTACSGDSDCWWGFSASKGPLFSWGLIFTCRPILAAWWQASNRAFSRSSYIDLSSLQIPTLNNELRTIHDLIPPSTNFT